MNSGVCFRVWMSNGIFVVSDGSPANEDAMDRGLLRLALQTANDCALEVLPDQLILPDGKQRTVLANVTIDGDWEIETIARKIK